MNDSWRTPGASAETSGVSRISGFARMTSKHRLAALLAHDVINHQEALALGNAGALPLEQADTFIENCVGGFTLPLGIATNFCIDGREFLVPMAVEESSVVAAASYGAKLARSGGGFFAEQASPVATGQVQFCVAPDVHVPALFTEELQKTLFSVATSCHPKLVSRGGGVRHIELRSLPKPGYYVLHIHVDTAEAMGANIVNTMAEEVGRVLPSLLPCVVGPKILTNLTMQRITKVRCQILFSALERQGFSGQEVAERICAVWEFADLDPFRAATHNKGIMNGIDAVVICTGNDWRAVEAGCHAYASLSGVYKPLTKWSLQKDALQGEIEVPIAVGTVGGVTRLHPSAAACLQLLGSPSSSELAAIMASVGLAQNLSAIRALGCEGIQRGHMALHEKNLEMLRKYDHIPDLAMVTISSESTSKDDDSFFSEEFSSV